MAINYTVDELVSRVRRTCQLKSDNGKVSTDEIVQICDEEIQQNLFPSLMTDRDDYQMTASVIQLSSGISQYRLPFNAASATIDHVEGVQFSGTTTIAAGVIPRVETPQAAIMAAQQNTSGRGGIGCYILLGDTIQVFPTPNAWIADNVVMRIVHEWRPPRLALLSTASVCSSFALNVDPNYIDVTLSAVLASSMNEGDLVDIVPAVPPLMGILLDATIDDDALDPIIKINPGYSQTPTQALALLQSSPLPYMTPRGHSPVFPLPDAWWNAAVLACSASVCRIIGDAQGFETNMVASQGAIERLVTFQASRVRKQPHIPFDRSSPLRRTVWRGGGWFNNGGL